MAYSIKVRNIRGRIAYLRDDGRTAGREFFSVSVFPDGTRTLRDVVFTLDRRWRPIDAYLRVAQSQRFLGSGWYRVNQYNLKLSGAGAKLAGLRVVRRIPKAQRRRTIWPLRNHRAAFVMPGTLKYLQVVTHQYVPTAK